MSRLRAALRPLAMTYAGVFLGMLLTLVIAPLYIRHLGFERMGLLAIGQAIYGYLTLTNGGLSTSTQILVSHAKGRDDWPGVAKVLRHGLLLSLLATVFVGLLSHLLVVLLVGVPSLRHSLHLEHPEIPDVIHMVGLQVIASLVFSSFYDLLAGLQENYLASAMQAVTRIVTQIANATAAIYYGTVPAVLIASIAVTICMGFVCVLTSRIRHPLAFQKSAIKLNELRTQFRTGLKSFGIQAGATMTGYAPVAMITNMAGPAAVPTFTLPNQILSLIAGMIGAFGGYMLPVFGQAWAKGDLQWLQVTVTKLFEKLLLWLACLSAGYLALGGPFLKLWVNLDTPPLMLVSVVLIAASTNIIAYLKFLLSAINRHRAAAMSEILNGVLTLILTALICRISINAVGVGVALAGTATSYWLLPYEIRRHLGISRVMPEPRSLITIAGISLAVYASAKVTFLLASGLAQLHAWIALVLATIAGALVFAYATLALGIFSWRSFRAQV